MELIKRTRTQKGLANELARLRRSGYMNQMFVARAIGIPRTAVVDIENAKRAVTTTELIDFCKLYRVSPNEVLAWGGEPEGEESCPS